MKGERRSTPAEAGILIGIALITISVCVALGIVALYTPSAPKHRAEYHSNTNKSYCEAKLGALGVDPRAVSEMAPAGKGDQKDYYDLCQQIRMAEAAESSADAAWLQFGASAAGVAGLVVTLVFTALATRAASDAARQATRANELQVQSSELELRAYVFKESKLHIEQPQGPPHDFRLAVVWKNSGQTPAYNVHACLNAAAFEAPATPASIAYCDTNEFGHSAVGSIGPGITFQSSDLVPHQEVERCFLGERTLFYWGWVEYDSFVGSPRRRTEVCARVNIVETPDDMFFEDLFEPEFNGADHGCLHQPKTGKRRPHT